MSNQAFDLRGFVLLLSFVVTMNATTALAQVSDERTLYVYGPGGPLAPMKEAAERFVKEQAVRVVVTGGPEAKWIEKAQQDGDVVYGGAEYMLSQLALKYPALVDTRTREELYVRAAGLLVRKGNPKAVRRLEDLTHDDVRILDVEGAGQLGMWEDMAGDATLINGIQKNIAAVATNTAEGIERWKTMPELDAWIIFESWHYRLKDETDLVRLPESQRVYRGTPVAITTFSDQKELARQFVGYLQSSEGQKIFMKWGWSDRGSRRRSVKE